MTDTYDVARDLGEALVPGPPANFGISRRQGTITAVSSTGVTPAVATVTIGGTTIAGVRFLASAGFSFGTGDVVWVDFNGSDPLIIGRSKTGYYASVELFDGVDIYHTGSTPYVDFHRAANPGGDSFADYNMRIINDVANWLAIRGGGMYIPGGQLRAGAGNAEAVVGTWPADTNYAMFGNQQRSNANSNHYAVLAGAASNTTYIAGTDILFRAANNGNDIARFEAGFIAFLLGTVADKHKFYNDGEIQCNSVGVGGDNSANNGFMSNNGWYRQNSGAGTGWYNENQGCGMMGGSRFGITDDVECQHNETQLMGTKLSQGGWQTSGLQNFADSNTSVCWNTLHASGCCTVSWRKDSLASDIRPINSGGGCDWIYAASYQSCSEQARKRNIHAAPEYGLKTLRRLETKRFQYQPTDEQEIWAWELWKHHREIGVWVTPPSEHMRWEDWHIGYMAEEIVNLVPEIVGLHPDGKPQGIDYSKLVVVAIAAINELADRVEDLEAALERSSHAAA